MKPFWELITNASATPVATAIVLVLGTPSAMASVPAKGYFIASEPCPANHRIRGTNPEEVRLNVGQVYESLERNKRDGPYLRIRIPGAQPAKRWVELRCGIWKSYDCLPRIVAAEGPAPDRLFRPFFDDQDQRVRVDFPKNTLQDISPLPPSLSPFGARVLETCGEFGQTVPREAFQSLLADVSADELLDRMRNEVGCNAFADCSRDAIVDALTDIWFKAEGFEHIFCGKPGPERLDGLHFHGRYLQMQENGWGGPLAVDRGREEIVPGVIYSLGTQHAWNGRVVDTPIKGYGYTLSATDLIVHGTRAYLQVGPAVTKTACIYTVPASEEAPSFQAVYVGLDGGVLTFYPDATLSGDFQPCGAVP